tara:strand:- start:22334 stop:23185 length:852 start_codon:yes stop_codon:yes gene_type:complete
VTCLTISSALESAVTILAAAGVDNPRIDARLLLCHTAQIEPATVISDPDKKLLPEDVRTFEELIERRVRREPVSHLIGEREFWSLPFKVGPDVLDPRPDSETLINAALKLIDNRSREISVLDLGTGSGCLLITMLTELPYATGVGVDISERALSVARINAEANAVSSRASFLKSSWGELVNERFDLILCNPPYIAISEFENLEPEVSQYEPEIALCAGDDGLQKYRELASEVFRLIVPNGFAVVECGRGQLASMVEIFSNEGLQLRERHTDLGGIERCGVFGR